MVAMPMAIIAVQVEAPNAAASRMASSSAGKAYSTSVARITSSDSQPPTTPDRIPSGTPQSAAMPTAITPTSNVVWAPTMIRLATSMPKPSVPSRCAPKGGRRTAAGSTRTGSYGVQRNETSATTMVSPTSTAPTTRLARLTPGLPRAAEGRAPGRRGRPGR
jgi:hypothetical protein